MQKPKIYYGEKLYCFFISLVIMGYPIFSILASITNIEALTLIYRALCISIGFLAITMYGGDYEKKHRYSISQIAIIIFHLIYAIYVTRYFSEGYRNETLDIWFYFNNSILFSLLPIMLLTKDINYTTINLLKKYFSAYIVVFLTLCWSGYLLGYSDSYRLSFEKINPISLSLYAAIAILICKWSMNNKIYYFISVALLAFIMLLSGSRGPLSALILIYICYAVFNLKVSKKIITVFLIVGIVTSFYIFYENIVTFIPILSRFDFTSTEGTMSVNIREEQYKSAITIFKESPFFGGSLVEHFAYFYPHNIILESLMTGGITLFFLYTIVIVLIIFDFKRMKLEESTIPFVLVFFLLLTSYMFTSSLAGIGLLYFVGVIVTKFKKEE